MPNETADGAVRYDGLYNEFSGWGDPKQDPRQHVKITPEEAMSREELDALYEDGRFGRRIVEKPPKDATRPGVWLQVGDEENRPLRKRLQQEIDLPNKLREAHIASRHTGGSALLMVLEDGRDLDQPVSWREVGGLRAVHVLDRWDLSPKPNSFETDLRDADWRKPSLYDFHPQDATSGSSTGAILNSRGSPITSNAEIHADRVIPFPGLRVRPERAGNYDYWGQPVLEAAQQVIKDLEQGAEANSSAAEQFTFGILRLAKLHETLVENDNGREMVMKRLSAMNMSKSLLNAIVLDASKDESLEMRSVDFSGIAESIRIMQEFLAMVTGMPLTMLFGQMPSGLSTKDETGRDNYFDDRRDERSQLYKPAAYTVSKALWWGLYGKPLPEQAEIGFGPLDEQTPAEEVDVEKTRAETQVMLINAGVVTPTEARDILYEDLDDEEQQGQSGGGWESREDAGYVWRVPADVRETVRRGIQLQERTGLVNSDRTVEVAHEILGGVTGEECARYALQALKMREPNVPDEGTEPDDQTGTYVTFLLLGGYATLQDLNGRFRGDARPPNSNPTVRAGDGEPEKQRKTDVGYTNSSPGQETCAGCGWYEDGGGCKIVRGRVAASGWCRLWGTLDLAVEDGEG